tara:strand:+ start:763 stop:1131 length:369 start_codon:yes stop_codon:yes gene_type:complete
MAKEDSVWSIDELVALTDEVQKGKCDFRGKEFTYQYCELTEAEEPKTLPLDDNASDDERADWYQRVGSERILLMINKANDKDPNGVTITSDNWSKLPVTLRYSVMSDIMNLSTEASGNFPTG